MSLAPVDTYMFFVEAELDVPAELEDRIQPRLAARVTSVSDGAN